MAAEEGALGAPDSWPAARGCRIPRVPSAPSQAGSRAGRARPRSPLSPGPAGAGPARQESAESEKATGGRQSPGQVACLFPWLRGLCLPGSAWEKQVGTEHTLPVVPGTKAAVQVPGRHPLPASPQERWLRLGQSGLSCQAPSPSLGPWGQDEARGGRQRRARAGGLQRCPQDTDPSPARPSRAPGLNVWVRSQQRGQQWQCMVASRPQGAPKEQAWWEVHFCCHCGQMSSLALSQASPQCQGAHARSSPRPKTLRRQELPEVCARGQRLTAMAAAVLP